MRRILIKSKERGYRHLTQISSCVASPAPFTSGNHNVCVEKEELVAVSPWVPVKTKSCNVTYIETAAEVGRRRYNLFSRQTQSVFLSRKLA